MTNLADVLQHVGPWSAYGNVQCTINSVTDRADEVQEGDVFVAIAGTKVNAHTLIPMAVDRGAVAVVVQQDSRQGFDSLTLPDSVVCIEVPDSRYALALLAKHVHTDVAAAVSALTWIGVTGTNGKTTVATLLTQLLRNAGLRVAYIGTTGAEYCDAHGMLHHCDTNYTTPHARVLYRLAREFRAQGITHVVMEVSSHALDQHRVAGISFSGALFTNLTHDHLDYHGTMERYAAAKKKLFTNLENGAWAVVNGTDPYSAVMLEHCCARHTIVTTSNVQCTQDGTTLTVHAKGAMEVQPIVLHTKLLGEFNALNVALVATAALNSGVSMHTVVHGSAHLRAPRGRLERYVLPNGSIAIVDYAHTPDALQKALSVLRPLARSITVVFGCGGDRDKQKRPVMGRIAQTMADVVVVTSDNPRTEPPQAIISDILGGMDSKDNVVVMEDRAAAIAYALEGGGPGNIVLIAGKGHEQYQHVGGDYIPFSDQQQIISAGGLAQ